MKTKVSVVFPATEPNQPTWPYMGYDVEKRSREVLAVLASQFRDFEFSASVHYSLEEAKKAYRDEGSAFDGYLVYLTGLWSGIAAFYAQNARPVIVADELYSGSGELLRVNSLIEKEHLPVVSIASSDFQDVVDTVALFGVMKKMRNANVLVVADGETWGAREGLLSRAVEIFGTRFTQMNSDALKGYYERVDSGEAEYWKDKWIHDAAQVVEPDEAEILRSARMYLALKAAKEDAQADAVTVDCLGLYYANKLFAYPCLGFFQLNNEGSTGVCEADVDATLTQLLIRYLVDRPGYVSDPVVDTASDQIIYAHCVATNRPFGANGLSNPYTIRSHAEDHKGASVQSLLPVGYPITSVKVSTLHNAFAIHTGKSVANIVDEKGCRTKLAAEVDAQKILDNYHYEIFSWHRVTCYGEYRKQFIRLARLYGLDVHEEDR